MFADTVSIVFTATFNTQIKFSRRRESAGIIRPPAQKYYLRQGRKKQHKHKLFGPDFPRTFLTLTPGRPWVKKFLPTTGAAEKRTFWCGCPRFLARTSMTRRVFEKLCTKKVCIDFLAPITQKKSGGVIFGAIATILRNQLRLENSPRNIFHAC